MMRTTKTKYAAGLPAAPYAISILFLGRQRNRILHFLRTAETDFDVVVSLDGLSCRTAWSSPKIRLVVAGILVVLRHVLGTDVEVIVFHHYLSTSPLLRVS